MFFWGATILHSQLLNTPVQSQFSDGNALWQFRIVAYFKGNLSDPSRGPYQNFQNDAGGRK
jgi:hypothetical protein